MFNVRQILILVVAGILISQIIVLRIAPLFYDLYIYSYRIEVYLLVCNCEDAYSG